MKMNMRFKCAAAALSKAVLAATIAALLLPATAAPVVDTVNGEKIELLRSDVPQSPGVVVFENGARETLDTWNKVIADIGKESTVFAYNRPGYGRSDCWRRPNIDPPCRLKFDPGLGATF